MQLWNGRPAAFHALSHELLHQLEDLRAHRLLGLRTTAPTILSFTATAIVDVVGIRLGPEPHRPAVQSRCIHKLRNIGRRHNWHARGRAFCFVAVKKGNVASTREECERQGYLYLYIHIYTYIHTVYKYIKYV